MRIIKSDDECLSRLHDGDSRALEYIIRIYFPVLCSYAENIVTDKRQAEDITEEIFIKVWEKKPVFNSFNELKSFLYTSVKNSALNVLRSRKREEDRVREFTIRQELASDNEFIYEEMLAEIRKAIATLSPKQREVFILGFYKKMDNRQIAEALKISEQTVRNQKSKALLTLRALLRNKTFEMLLLLIS